MLLESLKSFCNLVFAILKYSVTANKDTLWNVPSSVKVIWCTVCMFHNIEIQPENTRASRNSIDLYFLSYLSPSHTVTRKEKTREHLNISNLIMEESSWTWFSVTRGTVIWLNHFSGHFVRRISSIIPLIAMSNAIASWVLSQTKVSASGQKVTFCLHDYFLKHLSSPRCESWLFCL